MLSLKSVVLASLLVISPMTRATEAKKASAPRSKSDWIALGNEYYQSHRENDALKAWEKALSLDPKLVDVRFDVGTIYHGMGDDDRALEQYRKVIEISPRHASAHYNLGAIYLSRGKLDDAERTYAALLGFAADSLAHEGMGKVYAAKRDWTKAIVEYQAAVRLASAKCGLAGALLGTELGTALYEAKRLDEAEKESRASLDCFGRLGIGAHVGDKRGNPFPRGVEHYGAVAATYYLLAEIQSAKGEPEPALASLAAAFSYDGSLMKKAASDPRFESLRAGAGYARLVGAPGTK